MAGQQQAIGSAVSIIDDYTGLIAAGVSPQQIQKGFQTSFGGGAQKAPVSNVVTPSITGPAVRTTTGGSGMGAMMQGDGLEFLPDGSIYDTTTGLFIN